MIKIVLSIAAAIISAAVIFFGYCIKRMADDVKEWFR